MGPISTGSIMDESMAGIRRRILQNPGLPDENRRPES
jgi:hypothetical protein